MKLLINGVDIIDDVNLLEAVYEDYATASSSRLYLKFDDADGLWQNWQLKNNDEISIIEAQCNTGTLFVHKTAISRGLCNLFVKSIPAVAPSVQHSTYENVKLSKFVKEAAKEFGFDFDIKNMTDQFYKSISINNNSYFNKLKELCALEGIGIIFYNKTIILFDENKIENIDSTGDLIVESDDDFNISDNPQMLYGKCIIQNAELTGKFNANNGSSNVLFYGKNTPASSVGEANRFAKGILRAANKSAKVGTVTTELKTEFAAGSVVNLINNKAQIYNDKIYIYKCRHDFIRNTTKIFFRYGIEDY